MAFYRTIHKFIDQSIKYHIFIGMSILNGLEFMTSSLFILIVLLDTCYFAHLLIRLLRKLSVTSIPAFLASLHARVAQGKELTTPAQWLREIDRGRESTYSWVQKGVGHYS